MWRECWQKTISGLTPSNEACAIGAPETIMDIDMHEIIQQGSTSHE